LNLSSLESLVIDEADLILSYGHDEDVRQIFSGGYLPKVYQSFLMSATMTDDVETLKGLALRTPVSSSAHYLSSLFSANFGLSGHPEARRRRR
jgi:superfamily II DNA/RNA helicase